MNDHPQPGDGPLRALLREARPAPPLPPRFEEAVWRRIERAPARQNSHSLVEWFDRAAAWLLRPRLAMAGAAALVLIGIAVGVRQGTSLAHDQARQRYLAAVSPLTPP